MIVSGNDLYAGMLMVIGLIERIPLLSRAFSGVTIISGLTVSL
jgi:hypothetical protein